MSKAFAALFIVIIFLLQFSVLGSFVDAGRIPNLFVAFAAAAAVIFGFNKSAGAIIFAGIMMDTGGPLMVGSGALALTLLIWSIDKAKLVAELRLRRYIFALFFSLIVALSLILFDLLYEGLARAQYYLFSAGGPIQIRQFSADYAWKILLTSVSAMPIYFFLRRFGKLPESGMIVRR